MEVLALQRIRDVRRCEIVRERERRAQVALTAPGGGKVDREDDGFEARLDNAREQVGGEAAVARPIDLKPEPSARRGGCELAQGEARERRLAQNTPYSGRAPGD